MRGFVIAALLALAGPLWSQNAPLIPEVTFEQTPLEDALAFLSARSAELGSSRASFIIIEPEAIATRETAAFSPSLDFSGPEASFDAPAGDGADVNAQSVAGIPVTLSLANVSLGQVVRYVCDLAGVTFSHDGGTNYLIGRAEDLKAVLESRSLRRQKSPGGEALLRSLATHPIPSFEASGMPLSELSVYFSGQASAQGQRPLNVIIREGGDRTVDLNLASASGLSVINYATDLTRLGYRADPFALVIGVPGRLAAASPAGEMPVSLRSERAPEVNLDNVTLRDVVDLVRSAGNVNVLMSGDAGERQLSLYLRDIPLSEVLRYAAELTGTELSYDGQAIKLTGGN